MQQITAPGRPVCEFKPGKPRQGEGEIRPTTVWVGAYGANMQRPSVTLVGPVVLVSQRLNDT